MVSKCFCAIPSSPGEYTLTYSITIQITTKQPSSLMVINSPAWMRKVAQFMTSAMNISLSNTTVAAALQQVGNLRIYPCYHRLLPIVNLLFTSSFPCVSWTGCQICSRDQRCASTDLPTELLSDASVCVRTTACVFLSSTQSRYVHNHA